MADYYTHTALTVTGEVDGLKWLQTLLTDPDGYDDEMRAFVAEVVDETAYDAGENPFYGITAMPLTTSEGVVLHIYSDESFDITALAMALQKWLQHTNSTLPVYFTWADTCSKPLPNEFGGGACVVTVDDINVMSTGLWLRENMQETGEA